MRRPFVALLAPALLPATLGAQAIRGVVLDSASRQPVPGVVVSLLDSGSALIGRIITNQRGQFNVPNAASIRRLRLQRIGFRPRLQEVHLDANGMTDVEIRMAMLPSMLEPVRVQANSKCPRRSDNQVALALLDQTRAGVLATAVAKGRDAAKMRVLAYQRTFDDRERIVEQTVRIDSAIALLPFAAARRPRDFVANGFVRETPGGELEFYAPDAEVLVSDEFANGYCFRLVDRDRTRPNQVGLGFEPAARSRGRQAIEGVIWTDTAARALVDLEYRYMDIGRLAQMAKPGGHVWFVEARPGTILIDRWSLRLPRPRADTSRIFRSAAEEVRNWYEPVETGAELAMARWDDGTEWRGHLGTLDVAVVGAKPGDAVGVHFGLDSTDYRAMTDSAGRIFITDLLPGPYTLTAFDPALSAVDLAFPSSLTFTAVRDSIIQKRITAPTPQSYAFQRCNVDRNKAADAPLFHLILGQVVDPNGRPIGNAEVRAKYFGEQKYFLTGAKTGTDGRFEICLPEAGKDQPISVVAHAPSGDEQMATLTPAATLTPLRITVGRPPE